MQYFSLLHRLNFIIFSWRGSVAARSAIFSIKIVYYAISIACICLWPAITLKFQKILRVYSLYCRKHFISEIHIFSKFIIAFIWLLSSFFYIKFQNFLENFVIRIFQLRTRIFWNIWIVLSLLSDRKHVSVSQRPIKLIFEIDGFRTFH